MNFFKLPVSKRLLFFSFVLSSLLLVLPSVKRVSASVSFFQSAWSVGSNGTTTSQVKFPLGIAVDGSGNVFIADTNNHRVKKLANANGAYIAHLGGTSSGTGSSQFKNPAGIAVDASGNVYVADTGNHRVQKLTNALVYSSTIGTTPLTSGTGNGQFSSPAGIAVDSSGNIYVSDTGNNRIQIFNSSGTYVSQFGSSGTGNGQFSGPRGIAVDSSGNIYVADTGNHRIQKFDSNGTFVAKYGTGTNALTFGGSVTAAAFGTFSSPYDIAVGNDGTMYIANYAPAVSTQGSIQRVASDGTFMMPITGLTNPGGVEVDSSGNVYTNISWLYQTAKYTPTTTTYQISNLPVNLDVIDTGFGPNVEAGNGSGLNSATAPLRLKTSAGLALSDVVTNLTADRDWSGVSGDSDRASGKSVVSGVVSAAGASATHTLYVPIPEFKTSLSVYICPDATVMGDVSTSCTNGVKRGVGSYTESFGNIVVSQVKDLGDNVTYWKITGMTGSGGVADDIVTFSGNGSGTVEDPYEITTCAQFQSMKDLRNMHFEIMNSIDCSETTTWNAGKGFIPVGATAIEPFTGSLVGNAAYTVSGIYMQMTNLTAVNGFGVFGYTQNATFSQIHITNILIEKGGYDSDSVGGLIGAMSGGSITQSSVTGAITQTSGDQDIDGAWVDRYGGMIGLASGDAQITFVTADVDITLLSGNEGIGGLVGETRDTVVIEDSSAAGTIHVSYNAYQVGGFIGWQLGNTQIARCFSTGEVRAGIGSPLNTGDNYDIGGFVGGLGGAPALPIVSASITDSYSTGHVIVDGNDNYDVGGFVGTLYDGGTITNAYTTGNVTVTNDSNNAVGGFVGLTRQRFTNSTPTISNSYATGVITTSFDAYDIGGFVGEHRNGIITTSHSTGNINISTAGYETEYSYGIGGFAGVMGAATVSRSYSTGNIVTVGYSSSVGGFVGTMATYTVGVQSLIEQSYSTGNVTGYESLGGFVGYMNHGTNGGGEIIRNSYSFGNVTSYTDYADTDAGGFAGYTKQVTIQNSYSLGSVTMALPSINAGGFLGSYLSSTVTNCYWNTETSGLATSALGTGLTTAQLKNKLLLGWDFIGVWSSDPSYNNGYPAFVFAHANPVGASSSAAPTVVTFSTDIATNNGFDYPQGMAVDSNSNLYIADTYQNLIKKFDASGNLVTTWGTLGSGDGQFNSPHGIAIDSTGNVYIADRFNHRIQKFTSGGVYVSQWGTQGSGDGQFDQPIGLAIDSSNNVYVVERGPTDRVQKFDSTGNFILKWGSYGTADGQFAGISDITIDVNDNVFVSDGSREDIQRFSTEGVFTGVIGESGTGDGQFQYPYGLATDPEGRLYVADYDNYRVQKFDAAGNFIMKWGVEGSGAGQFMWPLQIEYGPNHLVYVLDDDNRLQFFDFGDYEAPTGTPTPTPTPTPTATPTPTPTATPTATPTPTVTSTPTATPTPTGTTPTVTTGEVSALGENGATIAGVVVSQGGATITQRGIVYSSSNQLPTIANARVIVAGTTGSFTGTITGLTTSVTYYARAYATNSLGTSYGAVVQFRTLEPAALRSVYYTFGKFKYNKYVSPSALRSGDTAYIKNYNTSKIKLIQVFLYDYAKKGNQGFTKSKVTTNSMFLRTSGTLPTGKRYAYVMKFQDKATGVVATKYFVFYTTKTWQGKSVLGVSTKAASTETPIVTSTPTEGVPSDTVEQSVNGDTDTTQDIPAVTTGLTENKTENKESGATPILLTVGLVFGGGVLAYILLTKKNR